MIDTVHSRRVNIQADDESQFVEYPDLAPLGTAGGHGWFRLGTDELRIDRRLVSSVQLQDRLSPSERYVHRVQRVPQSLEEGPDGKPVVIRDHTDEHWFRATALPRGSYDKARAADERRQAAIAARKQPKPEAPVLVNVPALAATPQTIVSLGSVGDSAHDLMRGVLSPVPTPGIVTGGKRETRGRAVLAWLQSKGVKLGVVNNRLVASSPGGALGVDERDVLHAYELLLIGWVSGHPLACTFCSAEATLLAEVDAPLCDTHARAAQ